LTKSSSFFAQHLSWTLTKIVTTNPEPLDLYDALLKFSLSAKRMTLQKVS
jgi:hypothetical protein